MKPKIDPKVDCVFKAILGNEEHTPVLRHFVNAVLHTESGPQIQEVEILNPYNEREFESDKLSVVDVKARDERPGARISDRNSTSATSGTFRTHPVHLEFTLS